MSFTKHPLSCAIPDVRKNGVLNSSTLSIEFINLLITGMKTPVNERGPLSELSFPCPPKFARHWLSSGLALHISIQGQSQDHGSERSTEVVGTCQLSHQHDSIVHNVEFL